MGHSLISNEMLNVYTNDWTLECYVSMAEMLRPKKKVEKHDLSTITLGHLHSKHNIFKTKHQKRLKILFDTGCGATLIHHSLVRRLKQKDDKPSNWSTKAGSFKTTKTCKVHFTLPAFHEKRNISWTAYVDNTDKLTSRYDMIIGRDLISELGMTFRFDTLMMEWDNATTPMIDPCMFCDELIDDLENEILYMHDPDTTEAERIQAILDAKYCPADLRTIMDKCNQLEIEVQQKWIALLQNFEHLFDGTVGTWHTEPVNIELKEPDAKPYHAKLYPVPHSQTVKLKEEVARLCELGIIRKINRSKWACPMFTINKPDGSLRSLADLR
jgi:hypothetical protein